MSLVLANATLAGLSPRRVEHSHVVIENGCIASIETNLPVDGGDVVDCTGRLIMPGNVCAHTHLYSALARGMPGPKRNPNNFLEILQEIWWKLDRALDENSIRSSGLIGSIDAIRSGTTTLVDHHASPNFIDGSLDVMADALDHVGIRAVVCYEVTDRGGKEKRLAGLRENERFMDSNRRAKIGANVGAHASFTLDDETLEALAALARQYGKGVHVHLAEDASDQQDSLARSGKRAAARLHQAGILRSDSIAAHGVHLDKSELALLQRTGSWLIHNCRSNLNNSVGRAPVLQFGARSAMGTDGIDEDMFAESRTAYFRAREDSLDSYAEQFTDLVARGGVLVSHCFGNEVGTLAPGAVADLVILNYDPPTPLTSGNLAWHWMFAMSSAFVESVMVGGDWVLRNGEFCHLDEERIRFDARGESMRLWKRMEAL